MGAPVVGVFPGRFSLLCFLIPLLLQSKASSLPVTKTTKPVRKLASDVTPDHSPSLPINYDDCFFNLTAPYGQISSPGFPDKPLPDHFLLCDWSIHGQYNKLQRVILNITTFDLPGANKKGRCVKSFLEYGSFDQQWHRLTYSTFCGQVAPPVIVIEHGHAWLRLVHSPATEERNSSESSHGFQIHYEILDEGMTEGQLVFWVFLAIVIFVCILLGPAIFYHKHISRFRSHRELELHNRHKNAEFVARLKEREDITHISQMTFNYRSAKKGDGSDASGTFYTIEDHTYESLPQIRHGAGKGSGAGIERSSSEPSYLNSQPTEKEGRQSRFISKGRSRALSTATYMSLNATILGMRTQLMSVASIGSVIGNLNDEPPGYHSTPMPHFQVVPTIALNDQHVEFQDDFCRKLTTFPSSADSIKQSLINLDINNNDCDSLTLLTEMGSCKSVAVSEKNISSGAISSKSDLSVYTSAQDSLQTNTIEKDREMSQDEIPSNLSECGGLCIGGATSTTQHSEVMGISARLSSESYSKSEVFHQSDFKEGSTGLTSGQDTIEWDSYSGQRSEGGHKTLSDDDVFARSTDGADQISIYFPLPPVAEVLSVDEKEENSKKDKDDFGEEQKSEKISDDVDCRHGDCCYGDLDFPDGNGDLIDFNYYGEEELYEGLYSEDSLDFEIHMNSIKEPVSLGELRSLLVRSSVYDLHIQNQPSKREDGSQASVTSLCGSILDAMKDPAYFDGRFKDLLKERQFSSQYDSPFSMESESQVRGKIDQDKIANQASQMQYEKNAFNHYPREGRDSKYYGLVSSQRKRGNPQWDRFYIGDTCDQVVPGSCEGGGDHTTRDSDADETHCNGDNNWETSVDFDDLMDFCELNGFPDGGGESCVLDGLAMRELCVRSEECVYQHVDAEKSLTDYDKENSVSSPNLCLQESSRNLQNNPIKT